MVADLLVSPLTRPSSVVAAQRARVVVVDPRPLLIEGVVGYVRAALDDAVIVYAGSSVRDAVQATVDSGCDCAVVGTQVGAPSTEEITAFTMRGIPTIVLDERPTAEGIRASTIAGARGYSGKDINARDFARTLHTVLAGGSWAPVSITGQARCGATVNLSQQESRALVLYASGMTQQMAARRMGVAPSTVKHYIDRVRAKYTAAGYQARTKLELHAVARAEGLLP